MTEEVCCTQVIEHGERIHALEDRQTKTETTLEKIFDRLEANRKWQISQILTAIALLIEGIGLLAAIVNYAKP